MAKFKEKNRAVRLRRQGRSIGEIANIVKVSKSVVSLWCRDIALTKRQIDGLHKKMMAGSYRGRMMYLERIRKKRKEITDQLLVQGSGEVGRMNKRDLFIGGIALYWAEGTKSPNAEETSFSNSNPKMILWMLKWFKEVCGVSQNLFRIQIRVNQIHKNRVEEIEEYWSHITKLPSNQFTKTVLIKSKAKKVYSNNDHYGTVRIRVNKGTQIRRKILGFIEGFSIV